MESVIKWQTGEINGDGDYLVTDRSMNNIVSDELRARNLKTFYWKMLGYPGIDTALKLINNFCGNRKLNFGQYKNSFIGTIIVQDKQYITWCINNIPNFKLNNQELVLYNINDSYSCGGYVYCYETATSYMTKGDEVDYNLIEIEKQLLNKE